MFAMQCFGSFDEWRLERRNHLTFHPKISLNFCGNECHDALFPDLILSKTKDKNYQVPILFYLFQKSFALFQIFQPKQDLRQLDHSSANKENRKSLPELYDFC